MVCPTCKQEEPQPDGKWVPFCSKRCKMIDLGNWLDGGYSIPGEDATPLDFAREQEGKEN